MQRKSPASASLVPALSLLLVFAGGSCSGAEDAASRKPATVEEAAKVLDLSKFPVMKGAEEPAQQTLANLSYNAPGKVKEVFETQRKELLAQKWVEAPNSYVSDESSNATFTRDGYAVSLTAFPGEKDKVNVMITNHGNVALDKLPMPEGTKLEYSFPVSTAYSTEASVEATKEACTKLFVANGWKPYGSAGDTINFKQNAIELGAFISSAPAQGGKTMIQLSSSLMSVDLPAPDGSEQLHYSDTPGQISFDTKMKIEEVAKYYRETLAKAGWEATTEKPFKNGFKDEMIFRNKPMDMLTLELNTVDEKTRVLLRHESAAKVEEMEKRAKAAIEKQKMEKNKPADKLSIALPGDAKKVEKEKSRIEFQLASGSSKSAVESIRKQLTAAGYKEKVVAAEKEAGSSSFEKGEKRIELLYVDPGFIPAEITLTSSGVELTTEAAKKK